MRPRTPFNTTLPEIIAEEARLTSEAPKIYPRVHDFAIRGLGLVASDTFTIDKSRFVFAACMAAVRKHFMLAYLSAVRRHRGQCALNLRMMLEYACIALFALGQPDPAKIIGHELDGQPLWKDHTKRHAFRWLDEQHPDVSARFKTARDAISEFEAHGGIIGTGAVFDWERIDGEEFYASFFDGRDVDMVPVSLWQIGNFAMGVMSSVVKLNRTYQALTFYAGVERDISDFEVRDRVIAAELRAQGFWGKTES